MSAGKLLRERAKMFNDNAATLKREGGDYGDVVLLQTIAEHLIAVAKEVEA